MRAEQPAAFGSFATNAKPVASQTTNKSANDPDNDCITYRHCFWWLLCFVIGLIISVMPLPSRGEKKSEK
jgi:hypothetical protein